MRRFNILSGGLLLVGLAIVANASAFSKVYHGTVCQPYPGDDVHFTALGVEMRDNLSFDMVCPLVRDNIFSTNNIQTVWVEITNASTNNDKYVTCTLYTQLEDGAAGTYEDYELDGTSTVGFVQLVYNDIETYDGNEGSYSLECEIGPDDILTQITVNEQN